MTEEDGERRLATTPVGFRGRPEDGDVGEAPLHAARPTGLRAKNYGRRREPAAVSARTDPGVV